MKKSMEQKKADVCSKITSLLLATFSASQLAGAPHQRSRLSSAKKESKSISSFSFPILCLLQNVIYWIIKRATFGIKHSQPTIGNHELIWLARLKPTNQ